MKTRKFILKIVLILLGAFLIWFILHTLFITLSGLQSDIGHVDVIVVLGNEVAVDGNPSDRLRARLDKALELYENGSSKHLIVSGGIGKEGFDEAEVMAKYLMEKGVQAADIIKDSYGINTQATAFNSAKIMDENDWSSAIVVSQYFHIARTKLAFQKNGVLEVFGAAPNYFETRDAYSIIREFFAYYAYSLGG